MDIDAVNLLQTRVVESKGCTATDLPCTDLINPSYDLSTSDGETKCLNEESSSWWSYDCKGTNGKLAFAPTYCRSGSASYYLAGRICCPNDCIEPDEPVLDLTTQEGQTACFIRWAGESWNHWDCDGAPGFNQAAKLGSYCSSVDANKFVHEICCKNQCDLLLTGSTAAPPTTTTAPAPAPTPGSEPTTTTTTIPGGDTNPGGPECFGAIANWGPDFDCNEKSDMFCGNDSPDGLDVSMCCQEFCGTQHEKRSKKKEAEGDRKKSEGARKAARAESEQKRKEAESARKKQKKEDEWLTKRSEQEKKNKNVEDERKSKRSFTESQKKQERAWKTTRNAAKQAAGRRETKRKNTRADQQKEKGRKAARKIKKAARAEKMKKRAEKKKKTSGR